MDTPHIFKALNSIQGELAKIGISKDRKNAQQGYAFRGIDDVYGTIAPLFAQYGVVTLPHYTERTCVERTTTKGGLLFYVTLKGSFDLISAEDGSKTTCEVYGEAMDSADKATNKAMSAAYKYMCLQTFCIPTEGDNDADGTTHNVQPLQDSIPETFPITEAQLKRLSELNVDLQALCTFYKVKSVTDLTSTQAEQAIKAKERQVNE